MDINTCFETTNFYHAIAYYSHLIPIFLSIIVSVFLLVKSKYSTISKVFTLFMCSFCLWLIGDLIAWTSQDYDLVVAVWAPLDYINITFYLFGVYFFLYFLTGRNPRSLVWVLLAVLIAPAWWLTATNQSVSVLQQPVCEALNNEWLSAYKFWVEVLAIGCILFSAFFVGRKSYLLKIWQIAVVTIALVLFMSIFSVTEYLASTSGIYEINLYGLLVTPVFLFMIIYAVTNLEILKVRLVGTQLLPFVLIVMVGSQFFFLENPTNILLTTISFALSLGFGFLLARSGKREAEAREKVEKLAGELAEANERLKELDHQKDELLSLVHHQLAKPITAIKWNLESLIDGDLGVLTKEQKDEALTMQAMAANLADLTSMISDVSHIQLGKMIFDSQPLNLNDFFKEIFAVIEPTVAEKKIDFVKNISPAVLPTVLLDKRYTRMTVENLLTNAVKYTPEKGKVTLDVRIEGGKLHFKVTDTGIGIPKAEQHKIFGKMYRASNAQNTHEGNGFGLYVAKGAVEGQGGKIGFTSAEGKGTTFWFELPIKEA